MTFSIGHGFDGGTVVDLGPVEDGPALSAGLRPTSDGVWKRLFTRALPLNRCHADALRIMMGIRPINVPGCSCGRALIQGYLVGRRPAGAEWAPHESTKVPL